MTKALKIILCLVLLIAVAGGSYWGYSKYKQQEEQLESITASYNSVKSTLDSYGQFTEVLTVRQSVARGDEILPSNIGRLSVPVTATNQSTLRSVDGMVRIFAGVDLEPNVILTDDIVKEDGRLDLYDHWWSVPYIPVETNIGDYVDIRVRLPFGEEYVVFSHLRVADMDMDTHMLKFDFDQGEISLFNVLMADLAAYSDRGFRVYVSSYQFPAFYEAFPFYPVSLAGEASLILNPHTLDLSRYVNRDLRANIIARLDAIDPTQYGILSTEIDKVFDNRRSLSSKRHTEAERNQSQGGQGSAGVGSMGGSNQEVGAVGSFGGDFQDVGAVSSMGGNDYYEENTPLPSMGGDAYEQATDALMGDPVGNALEDFSDLSGGGW